MASVGAMLVVGSSVHLTQRHVMGDLLGLATALFYAAYLLSVKHVRRKHPTLIVMLWSSLCACPILGVVSLLAGEKVVPQSASGWMILLGLAVISQIIGQGLDRVRISPSSGIVLLGQPSHPTRGGGLAGLDLSG